MELNTKQSLSAKVEEGATGIHYFSGDETMEITTADRTLMTKIRHLASKSKDVIIDTEPNANNGGFMLALVPVKFLSFHIPHTRTMTEEQKQAAAERMRKLRQNR
jgi:hypothetical protein